MNMELSTGVVRPQPQARTLDAPKKYDVHTLIIIVRALIKGGKVTGTILKTPTPKNWLGKVWAWITTLWGNRRIFAEIGQDVVQVFANSEEVKNELLDLDGEELELLLDFVITELGIPQPKALEYVRNILPPLLDAAQKYAAFHAAI